MAAPLVVVAKVVVQQTAAYVQKKYPGGILGLIATVVLVAIFIGIVAFSMLVGLAQMISPQTSETKACVAFGSFNGNEIPEELNFTSEQPQVDPAAPDTSVNPPSAVPESGSVVMPVPDGKYRLASPYGIRVHPILGTKKMHEGMDFSAIPKGSLSVPILAAADGTVKQTGPVDGFGQWVTIEHNIKGTVYVTVYGHVQVNSQTVKPGDTVTAGQQIALMGTEGNSTGVHLHFEVWIGSYRGATGASTDPAPWLESAGAVNVADPVGGTAPVAESCDQNTAPANGSSGPWGGHENGRIPIEELCEPASNPGHRLRCDAAGALDRMSEEFQFQFGTPLKITDSYRDYDAQVDCQAKKGNLCATPGKSNHGWGVAIDAASNIDTFNTMEHEWMKMHAARFGWTHPGWAQATGSKPEPWHWEYIGTTPTASGDGKTPASAKTMAQAMLGSYGWSAADFTCLDSLWTRESSWNYAAANGSSSARGIPQAMMSAHFGKDWKTNAAGKAYLEDPAVQIAWGLDYIKGRYSSPCDAWAHSEKKGWY